MEITWIDVNDMMPPKSAWYLVTYMDSVGEAYWNKQQRKWLTREMDTELTTVIAWAKMPDPYRR